MKSVMMVILLGLFVAGCDSINASNNRNSLNKLEVGMSKEQVTSIMGKPYQREVSGEGEYWLYETERKTIYRTPSEYLTPVVFEDGKVAGWGRNYWVEKEKKFDVKIDQTVKQR